MVETEDRRAGDTPLSYTLKRQLNAAQQATLHTLERFGWQLKFIRRPETGPQLVVLQDPDTGRFAILLDDGELDENPVWHNFRG